MSADFVISLKNNSKIFKTRIVVSKKIAKKAVERNRIKRIIRQALKNLNVQNSLTIIVKKNLASLKSKEIQEKLSQLLPKG